MARIHPTALVAPGAQLADDVEVGPYAVIGGAVSIDSGCVVGPHVVIEGVTRIGKNNRFYSGAAIGCAPQDKKYRNEPTELVIGDDNSFFQCVTVSTGTIQDKGITRIGNDNWIMAYAHIAHDCVLGDHIIMANNATLAGHIEVGDYAFLGGLSAVHQFCIIGPHSMAGGGAMVAQDVPPFVMCEGNRAGARGLNTEGMKRRGFTPEQIAAVKQAYKLLYREGLGYEEACARIAEQARTEPVLNLFVDFFARAKRGIVR
ncbi:acyl-[acyl-carrier-protein]--UDP-N-acetylglucosamine O-acyltransferase [Formivibrio citricus]|uniref:Acyl-[acyl-carrier-protein]--UDP-N-acetylglucosamine O-acyltransferase n=1 Tax=Formivibrio citricus TaxID=83765 RepID=A0A1I4X8S5_9NEIS|nr:acyl-ACP--UDP-N-acetylglucosamine O-acyltransferase [Formivibrio citricus]SFN22287.1 acyl-[acyl-carrier-protein]--UDP-N-acetylglucosamine O-acyltransferase [Formivibrio citricus]